MDDVAQMLGADAQSKERSRPKKGATPGPSKAMKMTGVSRDVMHLLSGKQDTKSAALPPIIPTFTKDATSNSASTTVKVKVGNKWISSDKPARQWTWAPFVSSSRTDGAIFNHWVRANVEYTDYPYAKFDIHLDAVVYSDEEYATYLKSDRWTKSETDNLMELARRFELRWPVIHDRWFEFYHSSDEENPVSRSVDDLQHRYYSVAAILSQIRISQQAAAEVQALSTAMLPDPTAPDAKEKTEALLLETAAAKALASSNIKNQPLITNAGTGSANKIYNTVYERERRTQLDRIWNRSKEEEMEEIELRKELKLVEAQLRKLKKMGGHILAATHGAATSAVPSRLNSAASSRNPSRSVSPVPGANIADSPAILDQSFASTAPIPMPQTPYLQSGRLVPPATGGAAGLNKTLLVKMDQTLTELKVPSRPVPTKRVCDLYDSVRKDVLTLLTLKKMLMQKEGSLQAKLVKISKLCGGDGLAADEESLLGIAPPAPAPAASTTVSKSKGSKGGKSKGGSGGAKSKGGGQSKGGAQSKSSAQKNKADDSTGKSDTKDGAKKPKAAAKRKRKQSESKMQAAAAAAAVPGATAASTGGVGMPPVPLPPPPPSKATMAKPVAPKPMASKAVASKTAASKAAASKAASKTESTTIESKQTPAKKRARKS